MRNQTTPKNPLLMMAKILLLVLIGLVSHTLLLAQAATTQAKAIDVKATYRLSNDYTGPNKFLTVSENDIDLNMVDATRSPKQLWKFVPESDGKFRIVSMSDDEMYLDVSKRSDVYAVVMAETSDLSEETWSLVTQKDGKLRFLNSSAGNDKSLDVHKNGDVYSVVVGDSGDYSGQAWTLTKVTQ